jgi:hypothetical protein
MVKFVAKIVHAKGGEVERELKKFLTGEWMEYAEDSQ